jgi:mgtE-like transporter
LSYAEIRKIWPPIIRNTPTVRQASLSLFVGLLGFLASGLLLARFTGVLVDVPGLITLLPASNALRGNIYAPLGSRLGTYLHTGLIRPRLRRSKVLDQNLLATTTQSLVMAILLSFLSWSVLSAIGATSRGFEDLLFVAAVSAAVAGLLLSVSAFVLSSVAFRRGFDPDNLNAPLITAGGDFLSATLTVTLGGLLLAVDFSALVVWPVDLAVLAGTLLLLRRTWSLSRPIARQIFRQSLAILAATVALELMVGLALEGNLAYLSAVPALLVLIPPFIGESGNLASIASSRLSSAVHLGIARVGRKPDAFARADLRDMGVVAAMLYPVIGLAVFAFSVALGIPHPDPLPMVGLALAAGAIMTGVVLPLTYYTTLLAFKLGLDPDNVVIPVTNSVVDVIGVAVLLGCAHLIGIA